MATTTTPVNDPTAGIVNSLGNIPVEVLTLLGVAVLIALGAYGAYIVIERNRKEEDDFEITPIQEILKPRFDDRLKSGWRNGSYLRQSYRTIGKMVKDVKINERIDEGDTDNMPDTPETFLKEMDEDYIDRMVNVGLITTKTGETLKSRNLVPHRYAIVRDTGVDGWIGYHVFDRILNQKKFHKCMLIPELALKDADYGNNVIIDKDIQFKPIAGMYVANTMATYQVLEMVHYSELYEKSLEAQENHFEKINFYDSEFTKTIQKEREEAQADRLKWQGVGNSHANNN